MYANAANYKRIRIPIRRFACIRGLASRKYMSQLFNTLGIDWRLLLSQALNFAILLVVLRMFAYKPLMKLMHDRKTKIEEGLTKAAEAEARLHEANEIVKHKTKEADQKALAILRSTEEESKRLEAKLLEEAKAKETALFEAADEIIRSKTQEARTSMRNEAAALVRQAIAKTVAVKPQAIDEALIKEALNELAKTA